MSFVTGWFQEKFPEFYKWLTLRMVRVRFEDSPFTPLTKPIRHCRFALVSTGGFHAKDQAAFRTKSFSECSFREIPTQLPREQILIAHDHYNHAAAESDLNVLLPRDRMKELVEKKVIGDLAPVMISFMGAILNPKKLIRETAPQAALRLKQMDVDCALLTPA